MADRTRDDRDTNYFRESYGSQDANRDRDDRGQYGYGQAGTRTSGYGNDSDTRRGYTGYEGRDYSDRYGSRGTTGDRTVEGSGYGGRNFAERAGDEVKSWVGDNDAERRREMDRQAIGRYPGEGAGSDRMDMVDRARGSMDRGYTGGSYAGRDYGYTGDRTVQGSGAGGRNWAERTGDEVKSWVGDGDAERRREQDRQTIGRYPGEGAGSDRMDMVDRARGYGSTSYGGGDYGSSRYSQGQGYGGRSTPAGGQSSYGGSDSQQGYSARSSSYTPSSYSAYDDRGAQNRAPVTDYHPDDRGFLAKAGDEVKSWFGDDEADRRRQMDASRDDAGEAFGRTDTQSLGYTGKTSASGTSSTPHDPHYAEYRKARMDEYDRDYHEYKQTKQKEFHDDFHNFRTTKMSAGTGTSMGTAASSSVGAAMGAAAATGMAAAAPTSGPASQVKEHMVVDGSDGQGVGKVDHVTATDIKLTRHDSTDNKHHLIPLSWVASVKGDKVMLNKTSDEAMKQWRVADETAKTA